MSAEQHNQKYLGRSEAWLREKMEQFYDEIDSNNEENRMMEREIELICEEIGRQAGEPLP